MRVSVPRESSLAASRRSLVAAGAAVFLAIGLAACGQSAPADRPASDPSSQDVASGDVSRGDGQPEHVSLADAPSAPDVVEATRALGLDLLASSGNETVVISPASAVVALSMLGADATGPAEEQLATLLGAGGKDRDQAVNALVGSLEAYAAPVDEIDPHELPETPQLHLANQVVIDYEAAINADYLDALVRWFDAGVLRTDLASADGKAALDRWVKENTAGLIEESAVSPSPDLKLVLQNAVVLAARWSAPFDPAQTGSDSFTLLDGETIEAEFMGDRRTVPFSEVDGWKIIAVSYGPGGEAGEGLAAKFVLPPQNTPAADVSPDLLARLEKGLEPRLVDVRLPKLNFASSTDLTEPLAAAGLTAVFDEPLRYISEDGDLVVSEVLQQGRIRLDEEGTVAAAVTEIAVEAADAMETPEPEEFIADRPHLVILQDQATGWDLFQILVNDPREG